MTDRGDREIRQTDRQTEIRQTESAIDRQSERETVDVN